MANTSTGRKPTFNKTQVKSIKRRYTNGEAASSIADHYGVSTTTILNWLRSEGVTIRPRGRQPQSA